MLNCESLGLCSLSGNRTLELQQFQFPTGTDLFVLKDHPNSYFTEGNNLVFLLYFLRYNNVLKTGKSWSQYVLQKFSWSFLVMENTLLARGRKADLKDTFDHLKQLV